MNFNINLNKFLMVMLFFGFESKPADVAASMSDNTKTIVLADERYDYQEFVQQYNFLFQLEINHKELFKKFVENPDVVYLDFEDMNYLLSLNCGFKDEDFKYKHDGLLSYLYLEKRPALKKIIQIGVDINGMSLNLKEFMLAASGLENNEIYLEHDVSKSDQKEDDSSRIKYNIQELNILVDPSITLADLEDEDKEILLKLAQEESKKKAAESSRGYCVII